MPSKADQIKDALVQDGRWYVGQENIPWNTPFLLVITDDGSNLFDTSTASAQLLGLCGIPNRPIKQNPDTPRMHSFIIYVREGEVKDAHCSGITGICTFPPITVDLVEAWVDHAMVASVWRSPLDLADDHAVIAEAKAHVAQKPEFWYGDNREWHFVPDDQILDPRQWYALRVLSNGPQLPYTDDLVTLVHSKGYRAFAPDRGIIGAVVDDDTWTSSLTRKILFNPNGKQGLTGPKLQKELFGDLITADYTLSLGITDNLIADNSVMDAIDETVKTTENIGDALLAMKDILDLLLASLKYLLWGALGVAAVWAGWQGFKYVNKEVREYKRG